ncbi:MAG TPA: OsmC family protein [Bacteroidales bacterium]|nr:OsmC family protein [Bacteroidales bacterium]
MKSISLWTRNFQSVVDNGRNHSTVVDLPGAKGGDNNGPTALELCVMSLSGCIGTIFAMVAQKMRLSFEKMEVELNAEQKDNAPTITDVHIVLRIQTAEDVAKVEKCLETTEKTCPVGVLFTQAGVNITHEIIKL